MENIVTKTENTTINNKNKVANNYRSGNIWVDTWNDTKNYITKNKKPLLWIMLVFIVLVLIDNYQPNPSSCLCEHSGGAGAWGVLKGYAGKQAGAVGSKVSGGITSAGKVDPKGTVFATGRAAQRGAMTMTSIIFTVVSTIVVCAFVLPVGLILIMILLSYRFLKLRWAYIKGL